jgi:hypothetical protein
MRQVLSICDEPTADAMVRIAVTFIIIIIMTDSSAAILSQKKNTFFFLFLFSFGNFLSFLFFFF